MVSALTRIFGVHNLALAEDVVQDAFCRALEVWRMRGVPDNPSAWLMTTARNRALDVLRRQCTATTFAPELGRLLESEWTLAPPLAKEYGNGKNAVDLPIEEFMVPLATMVRSRFITARAAARHMIKRHSGVIIFVTGSPARAHVPGATAIGAAFGAIENLTENLAFEVSPLGVRVVCLRTLANSDSRSIQDTMDFLAGQLKITKDQAMAHIAQSSFLKVSATVQDTANAAVLIASDRARMLTGTVVNATAGAALD